MKSLALPSPIDVVVAEYHQHLLNAAGLTPASGKAWTFYVRRFLTAQFKPKARTLDWEQITAAGLLDYLRAQSQEYALTRLQCLASALRSFCRFLCLSGRCSTDWSGALPPVGSQGRADLPEYLSEAQLQQLLSSFAGPDPAVQRDHAIILCLARLGLRAGEVAGLGLEDLDWRAGTLRLVRTKGRRERHLPVSAEVGQALVKYLKRARPKTSSRSVFVSLRHGGPLSSNAVSALTVAAFQRAGLSTPRPGAHRLRHTVASHLVQRGVSLKAVADLLGHGSLSTTQVYAKVNLPMLREIPLPWPGRQEVRP
jgi:site-specific recombinase XerD